MERGLEEMLLPDIVREAQPVGRAYTVCNVGVLWYVSDIRQQSCPFGFGVVQLADCAVGCEACEELWAPENPHTSKIRPQCGYAIGLDVALSYGP